MKIWYAFSKRPGSSIVGRNRSSYRSKRIVDVSLFIAEFFHLREQPGIRILNGRHRSDVIVAGVQGKADHAVRNRLEALDLDRHVLGVEVMRKVLVAYIIKRPSALHNMRNLLGVSYRTMWRYLQELGELGVPLYSEPGTKGGYKRAPEIPWIEHFDERFNPTVPNNAFDICIPVIRA